MSAVKMRPTIQDWVRATGLALGYFALGLSVFNLILVQMVKFAYYGGEFAALVFSAILAACALLLPNMYLRLTAAVVIAFCCWDGHMIYRYYAAHLLMH